MIQYDIIVIIREVVRTNQDYAERIEERRFIMQEIPQNSSRLEHREPQQRPHNEELLRDSNALEAELIRTMDNAQELGKVVMSFMGPEADVEIHRTKKERTEIVDRVKTTRIERGKEVVRTRNIYEVIPGEYDSSTYLHEPDFVVYNPVTDNCTSYIRGSHLSQYSDLNDIPEDKLSGIYPNHRSYPTGLGLDAIPSMDYIRIGLEDAGTKRALELLPGIVELGVTNDFHVPPRTTRATKEGLLQRAYAIEDEMQMLSRLPAEAISYLKDKSELRAGVYGSGYASYKPTPAAKLELLSELEVVLKERAIDDPRNNHYEDIIERISLKREEIQEQIANTSSIGLNALIAAIDPSAGSPKKNI